MSTNEIVENYIEGCQLEIFNSSAGLNSAAIYNLAVFANYYYRSILIRL